MRRRCVPWFLGTALAVISALQVRGAAPAPIDAIAAPVTAAKNAPSPSGKPDRAPDVDYVVSPEKVVDKMLELAEVKKGDVVYDLGSGDGRILIAAAKKYGVRAKGFEIDPKLVAKLRENIKQAGVENLATVEQADLLTVDLSEATVVTLYLLPSVNVQLIPQLERLTPGSRIVSHDFDIRGIQTDKEARVDVAGIGHWIYRINTPLERKN